MKSLTWVHISDIHFFSDKRPRFDQDMVVRALERDICAMKDRLGSPDFIFITGDVAFSADANQEYKNAQAWIDNLVKKLEFDQRRILIVPGNHDIDRKTSILTRGHINQRDILRTKGDELPIELDEQLKDPQTAQLLWGKFNAFADFVKKYGNTDVSAVTPFSMWKDLPVEGEVQVVGINTALLSYDDKDNKSNLAIGDRQIDVIHAITEETLIIVLMHHPPDELRDGEKLIRVLADRPVLLLSGHMHRLRGMQIESLGTSGFLYFPAGAGYGELAGQHSYSWGRLDGKGLSYCPRRIDRDTAFFISDTRPSEITKQLSPKLGGYYQQPLKALPTRLREWLKRPSVQAPAKSEQQSAVLLPKTSVLEEHLFGDSVEQLLQERLEYINSLRRQRAISDARTVLNQLAADVSGRLTAASDDLHRLRMQQWSHRCKVTSAWLNFDEQISEQALAEGRAVYAAYEQNPKCLRAKTRIGLANLLMALDQTEESLRLLPNEKEEVEWDQEGRHSAALIRQAIEIKQGKFPEEYADDTLRLIAAQKLLDSGDATRAVRLAREVIEHIAKLGPSDKAPEEDALQVLLAALQATIWDSGFLKQELPIGERRWILGFVGQYIERQDSSSLDYWARRLALGYYRLTQQAAQGIALLESAKSEASFISNSQLPPVGWVGEFIAVMQAAVSRLDIPTRTAELLHRLRDLAVRYPSREPIEFELARHLIAAGHIDEAVPHARAAFLILPGIGQRLQLAQCYLLTRRFQRALVLVSSLPDSLPDVLQIRAKTMAFLPKYMAAAAPLLHRHLGHYPNDGGAWMGLAQVQARLGHPEEAADAAWRARETLAADELRPEILIECAQLQLGSQLSARTRSRVEEIASILLERYPSNSDAARGRLLLLHRLGFPRRHPVDLPSLVELGAVWTIPSEQGLSILRNEAVRTQHLTKMYQTGYLSFEALCELTSTPAPRYLTHVLQAKSSRAGLLCSPINYVTTLPAERLRGAHLVCSTQEIILILHLGCFDILKRALGQDGKLLLFEDVLECIQSDGVRLMREAQLRSRVDSMIAEIHDNGQGDEEKRLAIELQRTLEDGQRSGFIEFIPRPDLLPELPPVRQQENEDLYEAWVRVPLAKSLAYHRTVSPHPQRLLLTADSLTADPFTPSVLIARAMNWQTSEQFFALRHQVVPERVLDLPTLVRILWGQNYDVQEELLALGFQSALDPRVLFHLRRKYQGLDQLRARECLDCIEWRARRVEHPGHADARMHLSWAYGATVWASFCAPPEASNPNTTERESVANSILQRSENLDCVASAPILLGALEHIASLSVQMLGASVRQTDEGLEVSNDSPASQMWRFLSLWAGPEGVRRGAIGLALAQAWLRLDRMKDESAEIRAMVLYAAVCSMQATPDALSTVAPEVEAVAILSAHWSVKPLDDSGFESVLQDAVLDLARYKEHPLDIPWDERSYHLPTPESSSSLSLPAEAVLLRASEEVISWAAPVLAIHQGLHDARAYDLLMKIAVAPANTELRRKYARLAVGAPWRQVRNAPPSIEGWTPFRTPQRFPRGLEDLRRMLYESPLDETENSIFTIMVNRTTWRDLPHGRFILQLACEIPGMLPVISCQVRLDARVIDQQIALAMSRLAQPSEQASGRLCSEIVFLCRAAEKQIAACHGSVNLREVLPRRFAEVVNSLMLSLPVHNNEPKALADAEYALLRLCSRKISDLAGLSAIPMREGLWLCYRLFQWLVLQLDRLSPMERPRALRALSSLAPSEETRADLLHPLHCSPSKVNLRMLAVLQGLYVGTQMERRERQRDLYLPLTLELAEVPSGIPWEPTSPELEALLASIASRELTEAEASMRPLGLSPSCLEWNGPGAAPDLALMVLLTLTHGRGWLQLSQDVRLRWIEQIPICETDKTCVNRGLALMIIDAMGDFCRLISSAEQEALCVRLQAMEDSEEVSHWRLTFYSALFALGRAEYENFVESSLLGRLGHGGAPSFFGRYLTGMSLTKNAKQIEEKARHIISLAGPDHAVYLIWGIGHVVIHGASPVKAETTSLLQHLAAQSPWSENRGTAQLLQIITKYIQSDRQN